LNGVLFEQSGYPWTVNICISSSWRLFFICSRNEVIMLKMGNIYGSYVTRAISSLAIALPAREKNRTRNWTLIE
jgi:hypothetical protein